MEFGIDWDVKLDKLTLTFVAEIPEGFWFAIGWGWHMFDVDMILLQAYPDIRRSMISDLWSEKNITPFYDEIDNVYDIKINNSTEKPGVQIFDFKRLLDTGDYNEDYVVEMDKWINICYAINSHTPDFVQNTDWGLFKIKYHSNGIVEVSDISTGHSRFVYHGGVMYVCWFIIGFLLLATKRYFKFNWLVMHISHLIMGVFVFVVTMYMGFKIL